MCYSQSQRKSWGSDPSNLVLCASRTKPQDATTTPKWTSLLVASVWWLDGTRATRAMLEIVSFDIGIVNMAVVQVQVHASDDFRFGWGHLIDITRFRCDRSTCRLRHDACHVDWIAHLCQRFHTELESADFVLIERQPPGGHAAPEQLLFSYCRDKARLVHPRSFLAHLKIGGMDYELRKQMVVKKAQRIFRCPAAQDALSLPRSHDVADALMFVVYFSAQPECRKLLQKEVDISNSAIDAMKFMDSFRCRRGKRPYA